MTNNSGVAFALLFSIKKIKKISRKFPNLQYTKDQLELLMVKVNSIAPGWSHSVKDSLVSLVMYPALHASE